MANEKRLIDACALNREIDYCDFESMLDYNTICEQIIQAPTVDAVEVIHGRWIWDEDCECWVCSNCEMAALNNYRGNSTDSDYCPNCGAKMDGDGNV